MVAKILPSDPHVAAFVINFSLKAIGPIWLYQCQYDTEGTSRPYNNLYILYAAVTALPYTVYTHSLHVVVIALPYTVYMYELYAVGIALRYTASIYLLYTVDIALQNTLYTNMYSLYTFVFAIRDTK